ncbi:solute carrier family 25, member 38 [Paragonimus westermani]|uniref:Solute carrier family 25, member 38 n=1 Tax=Paragonimus westermani TaxID=34504 RepID=A0A5J4NUW0_9TREM|nr:solute carrier family 25, member 38 [Paragonimus westermani]
MWSVLVRYFSVPIYWTKQWTIENGYVWKGIVTVTFQSVKWAFTAGCVGGTVSALAFQPLDVIKTRLQAVTLRGHPNPGVLHTVCSIYYGQCLPDSLNISCKTSHRGLSNFWVGTIPSLWRCVPGIGGYFLCLSIIERTTSSYRQYWTDSLECIQLLHNFVTGFCARSLVAMILNPFLLAKTQVESGQFSDRSMWRTLRRVHSQGRWRESEISSITCTNLFSCFFFYPSILGLYSGVVATISRDGPYSGLYFMAYSMVNRIVHPAPADKSVRSTPSVVSVAGCASFSAFVASSLTQPADVLRAQRQLMFKHCSPPSQTVCTLSYPTWRQVFWSIYRTDGLTGLWRGLSLRLARRTGMAAVSWCLYEYLTG